MSYLPSPSRLRYDLFFQLFWSAVATVAFAARFAPVWWVSAGLVLIVWQACSAGELRWRYRILSRDRLLLAQAVCLLLIPVLLPIYGILSWLPALTVAGVHLLRSNREYAVVRRRSQSFWDL